MRIQNTAMKDIGTIVKKYLPDLTPFEETYKDIHQHPELGGNEKRTAAIASKHLEGLGYDVTTGIGGHGVTGVLRNGSGKTILLRADMDALPLLEETGLPYASKDRAPDFQGEEFPVMHACGHDMHVSALMATAALLIRARTEWSGTLICLFQPWEEGGEGARAMVADGLYEKVPIPDAILGQHVMMGRAGSINAAYGTFMSGADSMDITIWGRGGHGSMPDTCIDPIVILGFVICRIQTITSRMIAASDRAVVTIGSVNAGHTDNVIPDKAELKVNIRSYKPEVRERILQAIKDIVNGECRSAGSPRDPEIKMTSHLPPTVNDDSNTKVVLDTLEDYFGKDKVQVTDGVPASEDISELARPHNIPLTFWFFGGTDPKRFDDAVKKGKVASLPQNHNSKFAPVIQPTLTTGVQAFSLAALKFLT